MRNYEQGPNRKSVDGGRLTRVSGDLLVRRFTVREPEMYRIVEAVTSEKLTSIDKASLCELAQTAMDIEFDGHSGDFVQAGCGLGGAAIVMAHAKRRSRDLDVHDPFTGPGSEARVRTELEAHGADKRLNVRILPGPYEKTLLTEGKLALAHVDCGEYEPMRVLLEHLSPRLVSGGHIIIDDYKTNEECRKSVDDYFRGKSGFQLCRKSRLHIIKN